MSFDDLRPVAPHELDQFARCCSRAFGAHLSTLERDRLFSEIPLDRTLAAFDDGEVVGTAASHLLSMTLPGGIRMRVGGVSEVAVSPTHRRQGVLSAMMHAQLGALRDEGLGLAVLTASEGGIYGRFGYGVATCGARYVLDKRRARLLPALAQEAGRVRILSWEEARDAFPTVFEAYVPTRSGEIDRLQGAWPELVSDNDGDHPDGKDRFYVCYEQAGSIDGYAVYRVAPTAPGDRPPRSVHLEELCSLTDEAYRGLWRYLAGIDLAEEVRTRGRPTDEPLRHLLEDARQLRTVAVADRTWVRILDVRTALEARRYEQAGAVTIAISDRFCHFAEGVYLLEVKDDGSAEVERLASGAPHDLALDAGDLASAYLGGTRLSTLAAAGCVTELVKGSARQTDRMLVGHEAPYCTSTF